MHGFALLSAAHNESGDWPSTTGARSAEAAHRVDHAALIGLVEVGVER